MVMWRAFPGDRPEDHGSGEEAPFDPRPVVPYARPSTCRPVTGVLLCGLSVVMLALATPAAGHDPVRAKVTWSGDVARLVHARCIRCHSPEGKGPMSLVSYEEARPWAGAMREEVLARRMPKWHAARGYGQFANDPALSPFDIALIVAWADGGALQGDPSKAIGPLPGPTLPQAGGRTVRLPCGDTPLPQGRLLAITPELPEGASAGFLVALPGGRQEIVAWIRDYESDFAQTYWLETPLLLPRGSRLRATTTGRCAVAVQVLR